MSDVIKVSGSYRRIEKKIQAILLSREDKEFLTIQHVDSTGKSVSYAGLTDIMNFLHKLRTVLIPLEDSEKSSHEYKPVKVFGGCRF